MYLTSYCSCLPKLISEIFSIQTEITLSVMNHHNYVTSSWTISIVVYLNSLIYPSMTIRMSTIKCSQIAITRGHALFYVSKLQDQCETFPGHKGSQCTTSNLATENSRSGGCTFVRYNFSSTFSLPIFAVRARTRLPNEVVKLYHKGKLTNRLFLSWKSMKQWSNYKYYKTRLWPYLWWRLPQPLIDITSIVVQFLDLDEQVKCSLEFKMTSQSHMSSELWFNKANLIASSPWNLEKLRATRFNFFSINGSFGVDERGDKPRTFYVNEKWASCYSDRGFMGVFEDNDKCAYVNEIDSGRIRIPPLLLYTTEDDGSDLWINRKEAAQMRISAKIRSSNVKLYQLVLTNETK